MPVQNIYSAATTKKVDILVPNDLLIVNHKLLSIISQYICLKLGLFLAILAFCNSSLTLSNIIIVSFIEYHIIVKIAITKTTST
jgi:hypothetical protein